MTRFSYKQNVEFLRALVIRRNLSRVQESPNAYQQIKEGVGAARDGGWRSAVCEAERSVGYPTSFLNLRWLFNDEIANAALNLRKLVGTNHPLLRSAKSLLIGPKSNLQSLGLIVLLVSKAAGFDEKQFTVEQYDARVLHPQRALAEIVEMKRTGHLIHQTMCNLQEKEKHGERAKDLLYGNKIVLLSGDFLLATSFQQLGNLRKSEVSELISSGLRDLIEGDFIGERDPDNKPVPSQPKDDNTPKETYDWEHEDNLKPLGGNTFMGQAKDEWSLRAMLTSGSVLGKGCQAAMKVAKLDRAKEQMAYSLGGHLALSWQLYLDIMDFYTNINSFSLVGAPVMFAIEEYPEIYRKVEPAKDGYMFVDFRDLHKAVRGTRAIEKTRDLLKTEVGTCLQLVDNFDAAEDANIALKNMILSVQSEAVGFLES